MRKGPAFYIYWNLNKKVWSIKYKNRVIRHLDKCYTQNAYAKVNTAGRDRVRREHVKNVHAYIVSPKEPTRYSSFDETKYKPVYYNPYNVDQFMVIDGEDFVVAGDLENIFFTPKGKVFCKINII